MFDSSMAGAVGFAMHEDRLMQATRNLRLLEAERGGAGRSVVRLLGTARKRGGMVVRTVAGLPVAIGGDTQAHGISGVTRLVRTRGAD